MGVINLVKPNVYVLGSKPEIYFTPEDQDGVFFTPGDIRLSIKEPDGDIIVLSGADLSIASGYYFYLYQPATTGWYEYEVLVVHPSNGRMIAETNGFEVVDNVYPD